MRLLFVLLCFGLLSGCLAGPQKRRPKTKPPTTSPEMGLTKQKLAKDGWSIVRIKSVKKDGDRILIVISGKWAGRYWREEKVRVLADGNIDPIFEGLRLGSHWAIRRGTILTIIDIRQNLITYFTLR